MKKLLAVSAVSLSMILTGCASTGATNSNAANTAKKAGIGALAGAVLGAGISKATGGEHTERDAAIGAVRKCRRWRLYEPSSQANPNNKWKVQAYKLPKIQPQVTST